MESISSLTGKLDELLNDNGSSEVDALTEDTADHADDSEWINIEDDVSDYISYLSSETIEPSVLNDPIFPKDITSAPYLEDKPVNASKGKENINGYNDFVSRKNGSTICSKNKKNNSISHLKNGFTNSQEFAAAKIVELSKKVRELNAQLISTQNKLRQEESKVRLLNEKTKEATKSKEPDEITDDKVNEYERQIKELTDKINIANNKLCEARNQTQQQKHELKLMQKALASEVGENVTIQTLASDGWRGRAQQIISLQQKVQELNEKLSQSSLPSSERSLTAIHMLEKAQDKERISSLLNELEENKNALNDLKNKHDQGKARIKVLTNELNSLKAKYEALSMKNDDDVKLINSLTARLTTISQKCHEREQSLTTKYEEEISSITTEFKQEKLKADQLKKIVIDRDSKIEKLEAKLNEQKQLQRSRTDQANRPPSSWSTFERPPSRMSTSTSNIMPSTEVERMRLMELVTVLNKRLDDEKRTLERVQDDLRLERQRSAKLETKCNRLELEKVGKGYRRSASSLSSCSDVSRVELAASKDRCALLEEKCLALESRLERLRQEKEEDARIYVRMVEEARQTFRDHIRKNGMSSNASLP